MAPVKKHAIPKRRCTDSACLRTIADLRARVDTLTRQVALYERESKNWVPMRGEKIS